jgi:hypothetical protein
MRDSLGVNAKTHVPALGEPITGFDVRVNECLQPAALISCSSMRCRRRADLMVRCGWMDGASSLVTGKAWRESHGNLVEVMMSQLRERRMKKSLKPKVSHDSKKMIVK